MIQLKTLNKRIATRSQGIFYKPVVNEEEKEVDKVYLIRWIDRDGREKLKTVGKHSQGVRIATCIALRNNTISAVSLGADAPHLTKVRSQLTLNDIAKEYFNSSKAKDIDRLENRYNIHFKNSLGKKRIDNISLEDLEAKQKQLLKSFAPATVNLTIGLISTIYNHHIKRGKKISNPAKGITHYKLDNKRERYLNKQEIDKLLDFVKHDEDCYIFVLLSLSTGGRLATIMNISKKDIDFENNSVQLKDFKNEGTYYGFFNDDVKELLLKIAKRLKVNDKVIKSNMDRVRYYVGKQAMNKLFNAGLKPTDRKNRVVVHSLRHTFASHLALKGASIITIKNLMHHKNIEMTLRYSHLMPDAGKDLVMNLYE